MKLTVHIEGQERHVDTAKPIAAVEEVENGVYSMLCADRSYEVLVRDGLDGTLEVHVNGRIYNARVSDPRKLARRRSGFALEGRQEVKAPMPGKVVRLLVSEGEEVQAGQGIVVVEAMKMQNEIKSPKAGKIIKIVVTEGTAVNAGQTLLAVE